MAKGRSGNREVLGGKIDLQETFVRPILALPTRKDSRSLGRRENAHLTTASALYLVVFRGARFIRGEKIRMENH